MNKYLVAGCCLLAILFSGCATSQKVKTVEIGDNKLTCSEIKAESKKLDDAEASIDDKKGVTGTNVAAALFWLPGLAYTYYDAGQAMDAINERRANMNRLYNEKGCDSK